MGNNISSSRVLLLILSGIILTGCAVPRSTWDQGGQSIYSDLPPAALSTSFLSKDYAEASITSTSNKSETLRLNVRQAVLMALQRNSSFRVDRLEPGIMATIS